MYAEVELDQMRTQQELKGNSSSCCSPQFLQRLHGVGDAIDLLKRSAEKSLNGGIESRRVVERDHVRRIWKDR